MNAELQIRTATEHDLGEAIALHKASYAAAYIDIEPGVTADLLRDHVYDELYDRPSFGARVEKNHYERIQAPDTNYRVATLGREIVGFAMTVNNGTHGFLDGLYVLPPHQGKKIGSLLLWDAEESSPGGKLSLMAIEHSNAYDFYRGRGYEPGAERATVHLLNGPELYLRELRNF